MITKIFTDEVDAIKFLTEDKDTTCSDQLKTRFYLAREEGLDLQQAAEKAQVLHSYEDHQNDQEVPEGFPFTTDEQAIESLTEAGLTDNPDGRAQERVDMILSAFRRYRTWGLNLFTAGNYAIATAEYQWYSDKANDLDEKEIRDAIAEITEEGIRAAVEESFNKTLAETGIVYYAFQSAKEAEKEARMLELLLGGNGFDLGQLLGRSSDPKYMN